MTDPERQIRFLYPPLFLIASLMLGLRLAGLGIEWLVPTSLANLDASKLVGLLAAGVVVVLALGFLIGAFSVLFLRSTSIVLRNRTYEATISPAALERIWRCLRVPEPCDKNMILYASVTFDHAMLRGPIHDWNQRRWNTFMTEVNSAVALVFSLAVGWYFSVPITRDWVLVTLAVCVVLLLNAIWARNDVMRMVEFQARLEHADPQAGAKPANA